MIKHFGKLLKVIYLGGIANTISDFAEIVDVVLNIKNCTVCIITKRKRKKGYCIPGPLPEVVGGSAVHLHPPPAY